jgi:alanine racemase
MVLRLAEGVNLMWNILEIDLSALRHNLEQVKGFLSPTTRVMPIVKSDAYGHGIVPVSKELVRLGADLLGVANVWEGVALREAGISTPIVVLLGISEDECSEVVQNNLIPAVYDLDIAQKLSEEARKRNRVQRIHLKIDTGMGRLGIRTDELASFLNAIRILESLEVDGLFSHLSCAYKPGEEYSRYQLENFKKAVSEAKKLGLNLSSNHIANSAAIIKYKNAHLNMVRPGIVLYGSPPSLAMQNDIQLKPVMTFKSQIVQIKTLPPDTGISYGRTHITHKETRIAVLPVGYDNGYMRSLSNKGEVLIGGSRARILGTICMNMFMVDISDIPDVQVNDEVVLLGRQMDEIITADEIAEKAGTISYEIYCALGSRNPRVYKANLDGTLKNGLE